MSRSKLFSKNSKRTGNRSHGCRCSCICLPAAESNRYFHLLDYRHGPIVVSGGKTLTMMLLRPGEEELQGAMARDVIAHGGTVVTVSDQAENRYGAAAHIQIKGIEDFAAWGIPFIYLAQMTSLLKAIALGGNPDQPQGLDSYISL